MTDDLRDFEERLRIAKQKRDELVSSRAEKLAMLKSAQEKLKKLEDKASEKGFKLEDLPSLIKEKTLFLDQKISEFESSLQEVSEQLSNFGE
jgi:DNA repair exonuclease SbcCD ATPase subunit